MNLVLMMAAIHLAGFGLALMIVSIRRGSKEPSFELFAKGLATICAIGASLVLFDIYMLASLAFALIAAIWVTIKTEEASFSHRAQFIVGAPMTTISLFLA